MMRIRKGQKNPIASSFQTQISEHPNFFGCVDFGILDVYRLMKEMGDVLSLLVFVSP